LCNRQKIHLQHGNVCMESTHPSVDLFIPSKAEQPSIFTLPVTSIDCDYTIYPHVDNQIKSNNFYIIHHYENSHIYLEIASNDLRSPDIFAGQKYRILVCISSEFWQRYCDFESLQQFSDISSVPLNQSLTSKFKNAIRTTEHPLKSIKFELFLLELLAQSWEELTTCSEEHTKTQNALCELCKFSPNQDEIHKILRARHFIEDNFQNQITIPLIAKQVGTNQCYLKRGFKEMYQLTIFQFIQQLRMNAAHDLLTNSKLTVQDIAIQIGYSSTSSFSVAFKQHFGQSPSQITEIH
jgi:AraC-like DNA-binding protein